MQLFKKAGGLWCMKTWLAFFTLLTLSSCAVIDRRIYAPTTINNPSFQKKNDHSFSVVYSQPSGFDINGGYAITHRLAIIGGVYSYKNRDKEETALLFSNDNSTASLLYRHKGYHGGLGVFLPLDNNARTTVSFFSGYIQGKFRMDERFFENTTPSTTPTRISYYKSDIGRYFLQGSLNSFNRNIDASFTCRYNYVNYSNITTDYSIDQQISFAFPPVGNPRHSQFLDFAFDTRFYFDEKAKVGLQFSGLASSRLTNRENNFRYYGLRFGIGVIIKNPFEK